MRAALALALAPVCAAGCAGCATSDRVALGIGLATLACDIAQTTQSADEHWAHSVEDNPIIHGRGPTAIVTYGVISAAVVSAAWWALPRGWRTALGLGVAGAEAEAIHYSYSRRYVCAGKGYRR